MHIKQLIADRQAGVINEAGNAELDAWLAADAGNQLLYDQLNDPALLSEIYAEYLSVREEMSEKLYVALPELKEAAGSQPRPVVYGRQFLRKWRWAAACIVLILGVGGYLLFKADDDQAVKKELAITGKENILPGKEGAVLTLGDGTQLSLDSVQNGVVALQGGAKAIVRDGQLIYDRNGAETIYNTITTQVGRQYRMTLPDGTQVWLNAASSVRYPTVFKGNDRGIEITGEVYLEVAKQPGRPFIVNAGNTAKIEVLGTSFNVNAYENESSVNTTLIEGVVRVNGTTIKPGQQAQIPIGQSNASQRVNVINDAGIEQVMAWKNGFINFEGATFDAIMRQLERWYDVKVVYDNNIIPTTQLAGKMTRGVPLDGLLKNLEALGVHFRLDGRKLIILQ
ncbi:MAG: FecR family protein [Pseudobacter sp.]|uniref:FecR family protein n=1 Tax=Pseudobacter sp. TaxID=2045420 RepID=UPI003F80BB79